MATSQATPFGTLPFDRFVIAKYFIYGVAPAGAFDKLVDPVNDDAPPAPTFLRLVQYRKEYPNRGQITPNDSRLNPESCLEALPAEIQIMVMRQLSTVLDLRCLLTAVTDYFRTFKTCKNSEIFDLVKEREKFALLREWIRLGSAARMRYNTPLAAEFKIPEYVPTDILSFDERPECKSNTVDAVVLRCFYGDSEISREEADHKHSEHVESLKDSIQDYLDSESEQLIVFDDEGKYHHAGDPTTEKELAPCILNAVANFTSELNTGRSDYCADYLEKRIFLIEDKEGCQGEGFLLVGITHQGLFHRAGRLDTKDGSLYDLLIERLECYWSLMGLRLYENDNP